MAAARSPLLLPALISPSATARSNAPPRAALSRTGGLNSLTGLARVAAALAGTKLGATSTTNLPAFLLAACVACPPAPLASLGRAAPGAPGKGTFNPVAASASVVPP